MANSRATNKHVASMPIETTLLAAIDRWADRNGYDNRTAAMKLMARYILARDISAETIIEELERRGIEIPAQGKKNPGPALQPPRKEKPKRSPGSSKRSTTRKPSSQ